MKTFSAPAHTRKSPCPHKVVWGFVAFTLVSFLLTLLAFGGWTSEHVTWFIGAAIFLIYSGGMIRTGWGVDLSWLRMTRAGSCIQLFLVFGSFAVSGSGPPCSRSTPS